MKGYDEYMLEESERKILDQKRSTAIKNMKATNNGKSTVIYKHTLVSGSMYYGSIYTPSSPDAPSISGAPSE